MYDRDRSLLPALDIDDEIDSSGEFKAVDELTADSRMQMLRQRNATLGFGRVGTGNYVQLSLLDPEI